MSSFSNTSYYYASSSPSRAKKPTTTTTSSSQQQQQQHATTISKLTMIMSPGRITIPSSQQQQFRGLAAGMKNSNVHSTIGSIHDIHRIRNNNNNNNNNQQKITSLSSLFQPLDPLVPSVRQQQQLKQQPPSRESSSGGDTKSNVGGMIVHNNDSLPSSTAVDSSSHHSTILPPHWFTNTAVVGDASHHSTATTLLPSHWFTNSVVADASHHSTFANQAPWLLSSSPIMAGAVSSPILQNVYRQEDPTVVIDMSLPSPYYDEDEYYYNEEDIVDNINNNNINNDTSIPDELAGGRPITPHMNNIIMSSKAGGGSTSVLVQPTTDSNDGVVGLDVGSERKGTTNNSTSNQPNNSNTVAFQSLVLAKLLTVLPEFFCLLADGPSHTSASKACAILDTTLLVASSTTTTTTATDVPPLPSPVSSIYTPRSERRSRSTSLDDSYSNNMNNNNSERSFSSTAHQRNRSSSSSSPHRPPPKFILATVNPMNMFHGFNEWLSFKTHRPAGKNKLIANRPRSTSMSHPDKISQRPTPPAGGASPASLPFVSSNSYYPRPTSPPPNIISPRNKLFTNIVSPPPPPPPPTPYDGSAPMLEGQWETYVRPFFLLVGAEVLLADMNHIVATESRNENNNNNNNDESPAVDNEAYLMLISRCNMLIGLFQKCIQGLAKLREDVCDPFLTLNEMAQTDQNDDDKNKNNNSYNAQQTSSAATKNSEMALSLIVTLQQLITIIHAKCRLMELQATLFQPGAIIDLNQAAAAVTLLLNTVVEATILATTTTNTTTTTTTPSPEDHHYPTSTNTISATQPLVDNFVQELKTWKYCFESCAALERCHFMNVIIALRQWQIHLPDETVDSRWASWMRISFDNVLSILPIYMDRVKTFATPLYGFDITALWKRRHKEKQGRCNYDGTEFEDDILHFLRQQQKINGPPTAVAIVLNAVATGNVHVERGFSVVPPPLFSPPSVPLSGASNINNNRNDHDGSESMKENNFLALWPAVYLRSTLYLAPPSSIPPTLNRATTGTLLMDSSANLVNRWQSSPKAAFSPRAKDSRKSISAGDKHLPSQQLQMHTPSSSICSLPTQNQRMMDYAPDAGTAITWPYNDWEALVSILEQQDERQEDVQEERRASPSAPSLFIPSPNRLLLNADRKEALTFRNGDEQDQAEIRLKRSESRDDSVATSTDDMSRFLNVSFHDVPAWRYAEDRFARRKVTATSSTRPKSIYHAVALSEWLTMFVIVKENEGEERIWSRRRSKCLEDNDIRMFLDVMASKLRVATRVFSVDALRSVPQGHHSRQRHQRHMHDHNDNRKVDSDVDKRYLKLPVATPVVTGDCNIDVATAFWSEEGNVEKYMAEVQSVFGLRSMSHLRDSVRSNVTNGGLPSPRSTPLLGKLPQQIQHHCCQPFGQESLSESAATFFLGSELATLLED